MNGNVTSVMQRKLLTVAEAAIILGVSRAHLYGVVMRGEIPSVKIGRARRIAVAVLDEWIARQQEEATREQGE
jgi:excisionase family DNA binding protein